MLESIFIIINKMVVIIRITKKKIPLGKNKRGINGRRW
jgi:hypothetical protein